MDILIFSIGFSIFVTYMFFLLRMINRTHKSQERAQNKYKKQIKKHGSMGAGNYNTESQEKFWYGIEEKRKKFPYSKR